MAAVSVLESMTMTNSAPTLDVFARAAQASARLIA
jgi:hypothetical protein